MKDAQRLDFSFSGLKTAVRYELVGPGRPDFTELELDDRQVADIAASFQEAVVDVLVGKTLHAAEEKHVTAVSVTGGVSANSRLRRAFEEVCKSKGYQVFFPALSLCTDNAAMIAAAGYYRYAHGKLDALDFDAMPTWPLGEVK